MSIISEIVNDSKGAKIISEWLGAGGVPVHFSVAEKRATICSPCKFNVSPKWWETTKHKIADAIKEHLAIKNHIGLKVSNEDALAMCERCGCCNSLSVWTPIIHIAHNTSNEQLDDLPEHCWKKQEIKKHLQEN